MSKEWESTALWSDVMKIPETIRLAAEASLLPAVDLIETRKPSRLVVTGNGASYYAGHALWLASAQQPHRSHHPEVVSVPGGLFAGGHFALRPDDLVVAVSASGEFRDLAQLCTGPLTDRYIAVTANPESTLGVNAGAMIMTRASDTCSLTHTTQYCAAVVALLSLWGHLADDPTLRNGVLSLPDTVRIRIDKHEPWRAIPSNIRAAAVFGPGPVWSAALETALLLKEVALVPAEAAETREGATSLMYPLGGSDIAVSMTVDSKDPLQIEALEQCIARGATPIEISVYGDPRLSPVTLFPDSVRLALQIATLRGVDVDNPVWATEYEETARQK